LNRCTWFGKVFSLQSIFYDNSKYLNPLCSFHCHYLRRTCLSHIRTFYSTHILFALLLGHSSFRLINHVILIITADLGLPLARISRISSKPGTSLPKIYAPQRRPGSCRVPGDNSSSEQSNRFSSKRPPSRRSDPSLCPPLDVPRSFSNPRVAERHCRAQLREKKPKIKNHDSL